MVTGGQRNDDAMLAEVLDAIRVPRTGSGRPRTRPDAVLADRAYTSGVNRRALAGRGIKAVIPQKNTEIAARKRKGSAGGRPPASAAEEYKNRNVVERSFSMTKQWRGLATRYDKLAITLPSGSSPASLHPLDQAIRRHALVGSAVDIILGLLPRVRDMRATVLSAGTEVRR